MDQVESTVQYLAQCDAETRDALVAVAQTFNARPIKECLVSDERHSAVNACIVLASKPLEVASALLNLANGNGKAKRGRPRGSKNRKAAAE